VEWSHAERGLFERDDRTYNPLDRAYWCHLQRRLFPEFSSEGENGFGAIVVYATEKTGKPPYYIDISGENSVTSRRKVYEL
jgi:hypothetical protein